MATSSNTAEGGTHGVTPSTPNSGGASGDALQGISVGAGNTITYDNTRPAHGTMGYKMVYSTSAAGYIQWTLSSASRTCTRVYCQFDTVPTATDVILSHRLAAGGDICSLRIRNDGKVVIANSAGATQTPSASTAAVAADTNYRFEMTSIPGATGTNDGTVEYAYYAGDSGTAIFSYSSSVISTTTSPSGFVRIGRAVVGDANTHFYDDFAASDQASGFIGPVAGNVAPTVTAGTSQTKDIGDLTTLSCTASDTDGTIASRAWSWVWPVSGGPTITNTGSPSGATATFTPLVAGLYVAQVLATDNLGATATALQKTFVPAQTVSAINYPPAAGTWTNTGGANHAASLADASTATYVTSLTTASVETVRLAPMTPRTEFSMTLNHLLPSAGTGTAVVKLMEGVTLRKSWTVVPTTTPVDVVLTMDAGECATVVTWNEIDIVFDWS